MEAVRIREGVETEEEVLTGAAIVGRQAGRVRVQLKTDVETVEETEEKPKHYRFTLIEFCTRETAKNFPRPYRQARRCPQGHRLASSS